MCVGRIRVRGAVASQNGAIGAGENHSVVDAIAVALRKTADQIALGREGGVAQGLLERASP